MQQMEVGFRRIFPGWRIVAANAIISFVVIGAFYYSAGAFINPLRSTFGWTTSQVSLAFAIRSLETGPVAPLAGYLVDRFGARAVTFFGVCVTAAGFFAFSFVDSLPAFYASFVLITLGASTCTGVTPVTNVANWFVRKRGRAMSFLAAAAGLSGLLVPLVTWLLYQYEWRSVLQMIAVTILVVGVPLSLTLRQRPEDLGLRPDGDKASSTEESRADNGDPDRLSTPIDGMSARQALKERSFWLLSIAFIIFNASITTVIVFLIPHLTDPRDENGLGLAGGLAGAAITVMTLSSLIGRFGFGWLGDYHNPRYLLVGLFFVQACGLAILASANSIWHLIPFFLLFAPAYGGIVVLRPVLMGRYFGRHSFGTIQGILLGLAFVGGAVSPVIVGTIHDTMGSYTWAFLAMAMLSLMAIPLLLATRRPSGIPAFQ